MFFWVLDDDSQVLEFACFVTVVNNCSLFADPLIHRPSMFLLTFSYVVAFLPLVSTTGFCGPVITAGFFIFCILAGFDDIWVYNRFC